MDPALWELYESGQPEEEVSVILRLAEGAEPPSKARLVSRFGSIATARIRRGDAQELWASEALISVKAPRPLWCPPVPDDATRQGRDALESEEPGLEEDWEASLGFDPPISLPEDGAGVVVGFCDWGFDFTHPNFRNPDGTTRLLALWDQTAEGGTAAPEPFGYGSLHDRDAINAALRERDPCAALGYHPASGDPGNTGSHGTHVADIAVGNRREPGSVVGLAPRAEIVFVHLGARGMAELANLGDSVTLLEGLDFVRRCAKGHPCVLHLSAGKTAGPHRGTTCLERAIDAMLDEPGHILVQSVGNYADASMHAHARIGPDQSYELVWLIPWRDRTPNELEIWYSGEDAFEVTLKAPEGQQFSVPLGGRQRILVGDRHWGNFYHRHHEPNSGFNHVDIFLYPAAAGGTWKVLLHGREVVDGRVHAWIERDVRGRYQSRFPRGLATSLYTTNTICNSFKAIAVGAYDSHHPDRPPTVFSSRGPTADGRQKPELSAPGHRIRAARSLPRDGWQGQSRLCVKSGTSMAAPWVSGTVALMLQAAARPLTLHEVRRILIGTATRDGAPRGRSSTRIGYGYLDVQAAVEAARRLREAPDALAATGGPTAPEAAAVAPRNPSPLSEAIPPLPQDSQEPAERERGLAEDEFAEQTNQEMAQPRGCCASGPGVPALPRVSVEPLVGDCRAPQAASNASGTESRDAAHGALVSDALPMPCAASALRLALEKDRLAAWHRERRRMVGSD